MKTYSYQIIKETVFAIIINQPWQFNKNRCCCYLWFNGNIIDINILYAEIAIHRGKNSLHNDLITVCCWCQIL